MVFFTLDMIDNSQESIGTYNLKEIIKVANHKKLLMIINLASIRILCVYLKIRKRNQLKEYI